MGTQVQEPTMELLHYHKSPDGTPLQQTVRAYNFSLSDWSTDSLREDQGRPGYSSAFFPSRGGGAGN